MQNFDFKSLFNKEYPLTTRARKFWVLVVGVIIPIIVLIIIVNLASSKGFTTKKESSSDKANKIQTLPTQQDTDWYKKQIPINKDQGVLKNLFANEGKGILPNKNDDTEKAMQAPISSNQATDSSDKDEQLNNQNNSQNPDYLNEEIQEPKSQYELQAGSVIPAILITGINSDLPGQIIAQVTENIYDSVSGNNLLIPQGTKVIGNYDSKIMYGQQRVLVAWKRLIFPDGKSLDLDGMPGVDISGYAGFNDQTDNHYGKIFGSAILMSILGAGAQISQPQNSNNNMYAAPSINQTLAQSLGTNLANTANSLAQKNLNIQPTLEIRPGYQFNISVAKDVVFQN